MSDLSRSFGVDFTVVRNLTGEAKFLSWYPAANGQGVWLAARASVRFGGNLLEAVVGRPAQEAAMNADAANGIVSISVCGDPDLTYSVTVEQAVIAGCNQFEYESSSSAWIEV